MDTNVRPDEIPDGFTTADPTKPNSNGAMMGSGGDSKQAQQEEQKRVAKSLTKFC